MADDATAHPPYMSITAVVLMCVGAAVLLLSFMFRARLTPWFSYCGLSSHPHPHPDYTPVPTHIEPGEEETSV